MSDHAFRVAMCWILKSRRTYYMDPTDPQLESKLGISKRRYPEIDLRSLTIEKAMEILRSDYWLANHCDKLPAPVALCVFDSAVQYRKPSTGIRILQRAINANADGVIGPKTIRLASLHKPKNTARLMVIDRMSIDPDLNSSNSAKPHFSNDWRANLADLWEYTLANYFIRDLIEVSQETRDQTQDQTREQKP